VPKQSIDRRVDRSNLRLALARIRLAIALAIALSMTYRDAPSRLLELPLARPSNRYWAALPDGSIDGISEAVASVPGMASLSAFVRPATS
jgi:hypothetical protein